ncbi:MAG: outer membrane protein transport protein [Acidobacteria bacterium]|nr:outer membrane protein transport protein [Acidobacteriota bacterium]
MALTVVGWAVSIEAEASAFAINELGARAMGMGGAFVAIADDGSALFYNPAGIAFQDGTRMELDNLAVVGLFRFFPSETPPGTLVPKKGYNGSVKPKLIPVGSLFMTKELSPKLTFGFGAFSPFGLSANFTSFKDSDPATSKYVGRFAGNRARLESIWFQPTVAYRLGDNSALALGLALVHTHLMLEQSILNPLDDARTFGELVADKIFPRVDPVLAGRSIARLLPEGRSRLAGTSDSAGIALGYLYRHTGSKTAIGLAYRSAVTHHLDGEASFAFTDNYPLKAFVGAETIPNLFPKQAIKGSFTTPANYAIGVANSALWGSTIAFDFQFQDFARFQSVPVNFSKTENTATPKESRLIFDFENSYLLHAGIERRLNKDTVARAGYMFDHSPVPDKSVGPLFPDSSRHSFTVGASRQRKNMEFTIFYQAMKFMNRTTNVAERAKVFTNGEYRNFAHLGGIGLRINLGATTVDSKK